MVLACFIPNYLRSFFLRFTRSKNFDVGRKNKMIIFPTQQKSIVGKVSVAMASLINSFFICIAILILILARERSMMATRHSNITPNTVSVFPLSALDSPSFLQRSSNAPKTDMAETYNGKDNIAITTAVKNSQPMPPPVKI